MSRCPLDILMVFHTYVNVLDAGGLASVASKALAFRGRARQVEAHAPTLDEDASVKVLSPRAHRALDFSTVVVFALAPFVLGFGGSPAYLSITLASVHLIMTLATRFEAGAPGPVAFTRHGTVEVVVGVVLLTLPFVLGWAGTARFFFATMGVVILVVWLTTRYRDGG